MPLTMPYNRHHLCLYGQSLKSMPKEYACTDSIEQLLSALRHVGKLTVQWSGSIMWVQRHPRTDLKKSAKLYRVNFRYNSAYVFVTSYVEDCKTPEITSAYIMADKDT